MAQSFYRTDEKTTKGVILDFKQKLKTSGQTMKQLLDALEFDSSANIQISLFSKKLKQNSNLTPEEIKKVISAFNPKNKTHISGRDVFEITDKYCSEEEPCGLECKFVLARAAVEKLQT